MNLTTSALLGIAFLGLSLAATFLMYYLWGFPFDKATRKSAAPKWLMRVHRVIGYAYVTVYFVMMTQMVPRLWQYQTEFPARTVAHLLLGFLIGTLLLIKISILRFFRHLEEWMPTLGTALFVCTVLLLGLSLPSVYHERALANGAAGGSVFSEANRTRIAALLPQANFPAGTPLAELPTRASLSAGRTVLTEKCVRCHDLKTILDRPRTPADWVATVRRMAQKPALFDPITESDQWHVSAYLIAITPDLQKSVRGPMEPSKPQEGETKTASPQQSAPTGILFSLKQARETFQRVCSQCHASSKVEESPPKTSAAVQTLIQRMQNNGMHASDQEIRQINFYITKTFVKTP